MVNPKYAEQVLVGIQYKNSFSWYLGDCEMWYLDYNEAGYLPSEYEKEREGIPILTKDTVDAFLERIEQNKINTEDIKRKFLSELEENPNDAIYDYRPFFLVDFDNSIFYSQFPESISFEEYIPKDWKGYFQKFYENVPDKFRYWQIDGKNYFK
ncbi:hypothetical protein K6959_02140 [Bacillus aquiflavi]|uniref:hypothetical protein n=1 Tax=Bacillus aquiflavi TaxID=2672567 RepID=UPI001CA94ECF|nr:hypothetical protein [Bacillus aquiflavi]UAC48790.1 hypothetical protein K6959_02140 [Bacillus aquiflavi]